MNIPRRIWRDLCEAAIRAKVDDLRTLVAKSEHTPFPPELGYAAHQYALSLKVCARAWLRLSDARARRPFDEPLVALAKCVWDLLQPPAPKPRTDVDG